MRISSPAAASMPDGDIGKSILRAHKYDRPHMTSEGENTFRC